LGREQKKWDLEYWHNLNGGNKAYEMTTRAGGSGIDIFHGHVWYLKDSKAKRICEFASYYFINNNDII